eukprot:6489963-Amphidinium_carterae.1
MTTSVLLGSTQHILILRPTQIAFASSGLSSTAPKNAHTGKPKQSLEGRAFVKVAAFAVPVRTTYRQQELREHTSRCWCRRAPATASVERALEELSVPIG